jgi:hypothetical protein
MFFQIFYVIVFGYDGDGTMAQRGIVSADNDGPRVGDHGALSLRD